MLIAASGCKFQYAFLYLCTLHYKKWIFLKETRSLRYQMILVRYNTDIRITNIILASWFYLVCSDVVETVAEVEDLVICVTNAVHPPTIQLSLHPPIFTFCQRRLIKIRNTLTMFIHSIIATTVIHSFTFLVGIRVCVCVCVCLRT